MIFVFSNYEVKVMVSGITIIYLTSEYPLRQIYQSLSEMSNDDLVVMLPDYLEPTAEYLIKIQRLYTNEHPIVAFTEDDIGKSFAPLEEDKFHPDDTLMFRRGELKSGLTDFSGYSPYNYIRERLIRLYNDGNFYVPDERRSPIPKPIMARKPMNISDHLTYEGNKQNILTNNNKKIIIGSDQYSVCIKSDISNLLCARATLDGLKDIFKKVFISFIHDNNRTLSDRIFIQQLILSLFKKPYFKIASVEEEFPLKTISSFKTTDAFPILKPNLADELCEGESLNIGKYILLSTKIDNELKDDFIKIKPDFINLLKKLSIRYKIVVIGENDYIKTPSTFFSIYGDIKKEIDNLVDLTSLNIKDPFTRLKQEGMYMRDAEWNIVFGDNDYHWLSSSIGKLIGYTNSVNTMLVYNEKKYPGIHVFNDINKFLDKIKSLTEDKPSFMAKVNMGMGDLMLIRSMMDAVSDKYDKVYITPNTPFFDQLRTKEYKNSSIKEYMEMVFGNNPYYQLDTNLSYPQLNTETLFWNNDILFRGPQYLRDMFCVGEKLDIGPYVTLTTKVRAINKNSYRKIKDRFIQALNNIPKEYKIVILGERDLPNWPEYKTELVNEVYCIYDDFIKGLDMSRVIDLSYVIDKNDKNSIKKLKQDCMYMKEAKYNITIGLGGGYCLTMVSGNIIGYWEHHQAPIVTELYKQWNNTKSNMYMTDNLDKFLYWIGQI